MTNNTSGSQGSSSTGSSNIQYNTPPAAFGNQVSDGVTAVLIVKDRQSDQPRIWSTGDQQQTEHLYRQVSQMGQLEPTS